MLPILLPPRTKCFLLQCIIKFYVFVSQWEFFHVCVIFFYLKQDVVWVQGTQRVVQSGQVFSALASYCIGTYMFGVQHVIQYLTSRGMRILLLPLDMWHHAGRDQRHTQGCPLHSGNHGILYHCSHIHSCNKQSVFFIKISHQN